MRWKIGYLEMVQNWLDELDTQQLKSVAKELRLLELCGNTLKLPHSRALGNNLFELRERRYGLRLYYTFSKNNNIILLQGGNKSAQSRDIKIAQQRLEQYR